MFKGCGLRTEDFEPSHVDDFRSGDLTWFIPVVKGKQSKKHEQWPKNPGYLIVICFIYREWNTTQ